MTRILKFHAENFKKLRVVEIAPDGQVIRITGRNGAGKSSVLDAVEAALAGGKHLPAKPIRRGEERATIRLELGDDSPELVVTRRFTEKGSDIVVEAPSGARFPSPQRLLDTMLGAISFDPLAFTRMEAGKQYDTLRQLVTLDVDIDALDGQYQREFEARTEVNRDAARVRAQATGIQYPAGTPAEPIDVDAVARELADAGRHNTDLQRIRGEQQRRSDTIDQLTAQARRTRDGIPGEIREIEDRARAEIDRLAREIEALKQRQAEIAAGSAAAAGSRRTALEELASSTERQAAALREQQEVDPGQPIETQPIIERLEKAQATNAAVGERRRRETLEAEAAALEVRAAALTEALQANRATRREAIARAGMPVEGLGLGENEVLFDGLPLDQASHAEQLRVSAAIAMAANPKVRVMLIRDGSLLDQDSFQALAALVAEKNYQLWLEQVETDGGVGILLEDGSVVAPAQKKGRTRNVPETGSETLL